jgi:site-specific DNA recombinase
MLESALYCRVSTEEQALEGYSIRGQIEKLKAYVSAKSWAVYDVYLDEGISGKNISERPAINRMIEDIKAGHVKNVLIFKLDRLTRSVADLMFLMELFKQYNCAFNSLTESIDTSTASGRMFIKIIGIFAEFERENIGERVRLGNERKAREGYSNAYSVASFGYDKDTTDSIQKVNESEAVIVKRIFDLYTNHNMTLNAVAKALNKDKVPTKLNSIWNSGTVYKVLTNVNLIGNIRYGTETPERYFESEGKHEPIISKELFDETQLLLEKNRRTTPTKRGAERNYFIGIAYCGKCGTKMKPHLTTKNGVIKTHGFVCGAQVVGVCKSKSVTAQKIENEVIDYINNIPATIDDTEIEKTESEKEKAAAKIAELQERLNVLEERQKQILDTYIEDNNLRQYRDIKVRLDTESDNIKKEIIQLTPIEIIRNAEPKTKEEIITAFKENWCTFSDVEKRQFLLKHISRIDVINHPIENSIFGRCEVTDIYFNT